MVAAQLNFGNKFNVAAFIRPCCGARTGSADMFLSQGSSELESLPSLPLFQDRLVGVVPFPSQTNAPLAADSSRTKVSRLLIPPGARLRVRTLLQSGGRLAQDIVRIESTNAIIELVAAGFGASILPAWCVIQDAVSHRSSKAGGKPEK
jgi:LysR family transcriptional regulator for metE and metH